jgi:hypothetical protein
VENDYQNILLDVVGRRYRNKGVALASEDGLGNPSSRSRFSLAFCPRVPDNTNAAQGVAVLISAFDGRFSCS